MLAWRRKTKPWVFLPKHLSKWGHFTFPNKDPANLLFNPTRYNKSLSWTRSTKTWRESSFCFRCIPMNYLSSAKQERSRQNLQSHDPAFCIVKIFLTTYHFQPNGSSSMDFPDLLNSWQFCKQISSKCISWQDLGSFKRKKKKKKKVSWLYKYLYSTSTFSNFNNKKKLLTSRFQ